jgi:hypothetical protein
MASPITGAVREYVYDRTRMERLDGTLDETNTRRWFVNLSSLLGLR